MNKTLRITMSLRNTYRVNAILHALKQIPLVKRAIPAKVYQIHGFKVFANVVSVLWTIVSTFLWKGLYVLLMVVLPASMLLKQQPKGQVFLHVLLMLSLVGCVLSSDLFEASKENYYAVALMRMNAREYTLVNYWWYLARTIVGFLPFTIMLAVLSGMPVWIGLALPLCIAGWKAFSEGVRLRRYERASEKASGGGTAKYSTDKYRTYNDGAYTKYKWTVILLLVAAAYLLPWRVFTLPVFASEIAFLAGIPLGILGIHQILSFKEYRAVNKEILSELTSQMDDSAVKKLKETSEKNISADASISSSRKGLEYLNELFIKRHRRILWSATEKITLGSAAITAAAMVLTFVFPDFRPDINHFVMNWLPYFVFIMYAINRGSSFTQALFMNCDHSLLTYAVYKQPKYILKLFQIRLREIMKINAVPALTIGVGLALLLFVTGGTENPLNYAVLIVSILMMSVFFSIHYLTMYYLLQPYNAGTELKGAVYKVVQFVTYFACYFMMQLHMPTLLFGLLTIAFSAAYTVIACILVYRLAPETFRIRD